MHFPRSAFDFLPDFTMRSTSHCRDVYSNVEDEGEAGRFAPIGPLSHTFVHVFFIVIHATTHAY